MPTTGHFVLHSNALPTLTSGRYELVSTQTDLPFGVEAAHTHVTVSAPRYTMPTDQILSTFPPANAEGAFSDRLPQIVLKRRTLPWERNPVGTATPSTTPWLALIVVAEGEAQLSEATPVANCVTAGTALFDPDDKDVEQSVYLAVTETVVRKVFPTQQDLPLLAHVREVDVHDTELANGDDDGWLAVVMANRLPVFEHATGRPVRYMACLVNVEGQLAALPPPDPPVDTFVFELAQDWSALATASAAAGADNRLMGGFKTEATASAALGPDAKRVVRDTMAAGFRYPIELAAAECVFRFPVLAHWSFTTNDGATFSTLMQGLDVGLLGTAATPSAVATDLSAPEVVQAGHVGLRHRTRRGEAVTAWYRGPLVPFPTRRDVDDADAAVIAHAADQLRRVVPDGREDLSLAAAFEIGRLLGLSQLSVVSTLLRFRREQFGIGRMREVVTRVTGLSLPSQGDGLVDLSRFVAVDFMKTMAGSTERMVGPRRPVADPGRAIVVDGGLDEVIAEGLGLNLAAIRKAAKDVGVIAALSRVDVPVSEAPVDMALLRTALVAEVGSVLDVATPTLKRPRSGVGGGKAKRAVRRDTLDDLIERAARQNGADGGDL